MQLVGMEPIPHGYQRMCLLVDTDHRQCIQLQQQRLTQGCCPNCMAIMALQLRKYWILENSLSDAKRCSCFFHKFSFAFLRSSSSHKMQYIVSCNLCFLTNLFAVYIDAFLFSILTCTGCGNWPTDKERGVWQQNVVGILSQQRTLMVFCLDMSPSRIQAKEFHICLTCNCWISEINSLYVTEHCLIAYLHQFAIG